MFEYTLCVIVCQVFFSNIFYLFPGSLVPWFPGSLVPWFPGSLVPWFPGKIGKTIGKIIFLEYYILRVLYSRVCLLYSNNMFIIF